MRKKRILFVSEASYLNTGYATYSREVISRLHATGKYDIAEFSVYGTVDHKERSSIPWKNYPNMPDGSPEQQDAYKSDGANQFGKWRFERVCIDFKPDIVCIPPDEPVCTDRGYVPIQDVALGDSVLTHSGKYQKVLKTFKHEHDGELISIFANGKKEPLKLTSEHPVLVYKKLKQTNKKKSIKEIYKDVEPEFVPAKNVKEGDLVVLAKPCQVSGKEIIDIREYLDNFITDGDLIKPLVNGKSIKHTIDLTEDFGRLVGYLIGDGSWCQSKNTSIFFNISEKRFVDDAIDLFDKCFGVKADYHLNADNKEMYTVSVNSVLICEFLSKWIGLKGMSKKIPLEFYYGTTNIKEGLISGLIRSDGCYKKNTVSFTTVSRNLAYEYQTVCASLNIPVNVQKNKHPVGVNGFSWHYDVEGYGSSALQLHTISQKHDILYGTTEKAKGRSVQNLNNYIVSTVKRVRKSNYSGQVYNIEVEEDNSYHVNGFCVHNCTIRDWWMDAFIQHSPLRKYFKWIWMPTVDASPQNEEWIDSFADADTVLTYSDWAVDVLKKHSPAINVKSSAPPSASEEFKPVTDKNAHKAKMGINPDWKIIGTVMRNQRRKLFPELFEAFGKYLKETGEKNTYLYCHTSYPDNGWDIPKHLMDHEVMSRVLFTYVCANCEKVSFSHFADTVQPCGSCGQFASKLTSVSSGASRDMLAGIYNLFDVYIQPASSEGFGIPIVEAAACGVPVMATDYSAMETEVRKLNGYPIRLRAKHLEMETGCERALLDLDHTVEIWKELLNKPQPLRVQDGIKSRQGFEEHYGWDKAAKVWEEEIDILDVTDWNVAPQMANPSAVPNPEMNNKDFLDYLINVTLNEPSLVNTYPFNKLVRDLNFGMFRNNPGGFFYGELSVFNREEYRPLNREQIVKMFEDKAKNKNFWEQARLGFVNFKTESWL